MTIAKRIKMHREALGLSQRALAAKLKMTQPYLAQLETGVEPNPTIATLRRLAKVLKCTVGDLVD